MSRPINLNDKLLVSINRVREFNNLITLLKIVSLCQCRYKLSYYYYLRAVILVIEVQHLSSFCQLQQFRQKKDSKGNNSKSSGKAGKSGHDIISVTATEAAVSQQHAADGERSTRDGEDTIALSESSSRLDSLGSDTAAATDELSAKPGFLYIASLAGPVEYPVEGSGVNESRSNQSAEDGNDVDSGPPQKDLVYEDIKHNVPGPSDPIVLREESADPAYLPFDSSSELESQHGEEQVTDIGLCLHS